MRSIRQHISIEMFVNGIFNNEEDVCWEDSFIDFLESNRERLVAADLKGHDARFASLWNKFVRDESMLESYERDWLASSLIDMNVIVSFRMGAETTEESYERFVKWADGGFTAQPDLLIIPQEGSECITTGKRLLPVFESPFAMSIYTRRPPKYDPEPVDEHINPGVQCVEIDCPTGQMIISDWIAISEFSVFFSEKTPYNPAFSVNHEAGRIASTRRSAEAFNMLELFLSNMRVETFRKDGVIMIGDFYDPEEDMDNVPAGFSEAGGIITNRWSLVAIDRAHLERHLEGRVEDPKQAVEDYLNDKMEDKVVQQWPPGRHYMYFSGDYERFNEDMKRYDFEMPEHGNVYAIISDSPLGPRPAPASTNRSRP